MEAELMIIGQILKSKGRSVVTATPNDTIQEITLRLASRKIGAIVILDSGRVAGIISERDIIRLMAEHGANALKMPAKDGMTPNVISCTHECTIDDVMEKMTKGRFRHVPVIEEGELVGIISIGDVVKYHTAEVELEVTAMRDYLATG
jgi:CBS domain-containing protein